MADELDPVTQEFIADMRRYIEPIADAAEEARRFATDNREVTEAVRAMTEAVQSNTTELRSLRDALAEDKSELDGVRDSTEETAEAQSHMRNEMVETAEMLNREIDKLEEDKEATDQVRDASVEAAESLGHLRDEALESAEAVKELGDKAEETAEKLDVMGLSGVGTLMPLGEMIGLIGALIVVAMAVLPAFTAMTLGVGAFGALAIPTIKSVFGALKDTRAELAKLPAPEREVVEGIKGLESQFTSMANAFRPQVFQILNQVLGIAKTLLPDIIPLAQQGAKALGDLMGSIGQGVRSAGFINFLHLMTAMVVPATAAIGHLAGAILGLLGNALVSLAPMAIPMINIITRLIQVLGPPLITVIGMVIRVFTILMGAISPVLGPLSALANLVAGSMSSSFVGLARAVAPIIKLIGGGLVTAIRDLMPLIENALTPNSPFISALHIMTPILGVVIRLLTDMLGVFKNPFIARAAVDILSMAIAWKAVSVAVGLARAGLLFVTSIGPRLIEMASSLNIVNIATKLWAAGVWLVNFAMDANPIGLIIIAIAALVAAIYLLWTHCAAFRDFWKAAWKDIQAAWDAAWSAIKHGFDDFMSVVSTVVDWVKSHWELLVAIIGGPIAAIIVLLVSHWHQIVSGVEDMVNSVISWFRTLVSRILGAVAGFGSLLWNAGSSLVMGLLHGIESAAGAVIGYVENLASNISSTFSSILSILSPSKVFHLHGMMIMQGLINGIMAGAPGVMQAIGGVANSLANTRMAVPGRAAGTAGAGAAAGAVASQTAVSVQPTFNVYLDGQKIAGVLRTTTLEYNRANPANNLTLAHR